MRFLLLACMVAALAACAGRPTLEELEAEALRTGDWSAVEKRERMFERRGNRGASRCPAGHISYCTEKYGEATCSCITRDGFRAALNFD